MMCSTAENQILEWRSIMPVCENSGKKLILQASTLLLLCFSLTWHAEPAEKLLIMRFNLDIVGLELYRNASRIVSKHAGVPFMKLNGNLD